MTSTLDRLRRALPVLAELPAPLAERLDLTSLLVPGPELAAARRELEERLGHHVVSYRAGRADPPADGARLHLCRLLEPAELTDDDLAALRAAEASDPGAGAVLVAYAKPMRLRPGGGAAPTSARAARRWSRRRR
ncbi:hypothetical protein [Jiangella rhizosphaerae]|uniref:Uncharacterized protein n=1 Tax=Jiangella rhizosphaerae TaxID=2293569 RepID=A0A418KG67_9ACTN|nr:hypothetical protein [Jiangella rhizosphaerae]RIQ10947.1 hypothetical protein DY240_30675 [Jiangella rhizosphaerae]